MNNISEDYLFMLLKLRNFQANNAAALSIIPTLDDEFVVFNNDLDDFIVQLANSTADTTGYALDKQNKRKNLEQLALQISNSLTAYFITTDDAKGRKLADYPSSYFVRANAEDLIAKCKALYLLAEPLATPLEPFGVPAGMISDFNLAINSFILENPEGSLAIDVRKENAVLAEKTRQKIMNQLNNRIDLLIRIVEVSNPFLYQTYLSARALDITGTPTAPLQEGTVTGPEPVSIVTYPYNPNREFRLQVLGGNATWGLGNLPTMLEFFNPIVPGDNPRLQSNSIGQSGDFLLIKADNPAEVITYKLWVYEG